MRQPTVQVHLGGGTVTSSGTTRGPTIISAVSRTPPRPRAAHRGGRSRAQLVNLTNIAAYVVARIVLVLLSGQTLVIAPAFGTILAIWEIATRTQQ
jgi:hypothetical protein